MIVYNPDMVKGEITSFSDLWDPQFKDSVALLDDARVMIGATLKTLGYSYNTTDDAQLAEAKDKLLTLKDNVRMLDYDTAYQSLLSGEVSAAYLFTPQAVIAQQENPNLVAVFPKEGIGFGIDSLVIPVKAPHPDNAHLFLDYLMRPEVAAHVAEYQLYINPTRRRKTSSIPRSRIMLRSTSRKTCSRPRNSYRTSAITRASIRISGCSSS